MWGKTPLGGLKLRRIDRRIEIQHERHVRTSIKPVEIVLGQIETERKRVIEGVANPMEPRDIVFHRRLESRKQFARRPLRPADPGILARLFTRLELPCQR